MVHRISNEKHFIHGFLSHRLPEGTASERFFGRFPQSRQPGSATMIGSWWLPQWSAANDELRLKDFAQHFFLKAISAPSKSLISLVDCGQCGFLWFSTCNDLQVIPSNITVTYSPHEPPKWIHPIHLTFRLGGYWIVLGEWVFRYLKVPIISQFKFYFVDFCGLITIHYIKLYSQFPIISPSINPQCIPIFWFEKPFAIQFFGILVADRAVP